MWQSCTYKSVKTDGNGMRNATVTARYVVEPVQNHLQRSVSGFLQARSIVIRHAPGHSHQHLMGPVLKAGAHAEI